MKTLTTIGIISFSFLIGCNSYYRYRLAGEDDLKRYGIHNLYWKFEVLKPVEITVFDNDSSAYRLDVTEQTRIEVKTTEGIVYRFYLQSITLGGKGGFIEDSQIWRGYDLLSHTERTVALSNVVSMTVLSEKKAVHKIAL